jgi:hypothetical protein
MAHFNIIPRLCLCIESGLFHSGFPNIIPYRAFLFPIRATFPTILVLYLIT